MRKCMNCKLDTRDDDIYCRNCGVRVTNNLYYVFTNIVIFIIIALIIILIAIFVASYFV